MLPCNPVCSSRQSDNNEIHSLGCDADLPPHKAVLVFGSNSGLEPDDGQRLQPGVPD